MNEKWSQARSTKLMSSCGANVARFCLALPEVGERAENADVAFLVRGKTFAYFLNNHHGDGRVALVCKAAAGEQILSMLNRIHSSCPRTLGHAVGLACALRLVSSGTRWLDLWQRRIA